MNATSNLRPPDIIASAANTELLAIRDRLVKLLFDMDLPDTPEHDRLIEIRDDLEAFLFNLQDAFSDHEKSVQDSTTKILDETTCEQVKLCLDETLADAFSRTPVDACDRLSGWKRYDFEPWRTLADVDTDRWVTE